ncbi:MAG: carboxypeptidase-like regulatory domain-containing protein [Silvanigrellaceae bacterium]
MFPARKSGHVLLVGLAVIATVVVGCGGTLKDITGGSSSKNDTDQPLSPSPTTGSYIVGILVDENGVAIPNAIVTYSPTEQPVVTDQEGRFQIPFQENTQKIVDLRIKLASNSEISGSIEIPEDVRSTSGSGIIKSRSLKVSLSKSNSIAGSSVATNAPAIASIVPSSILADGRVSLAELNSSDSSVQATELFTVSVSSGGDGKFALIESEYGCNRVVNYPLTRMPRVSDVKLVNEESLVVCMKFLAPDGSESVARSPIFTREGVRGD